MYTIKGKIESGGAYVDLVIVQPANIRAHFGAIGRPTTTPLPVRFLIDTGASGTVVRERLADDLLLPPLSGVRSLNLMGQVVHGNQCTAELQLPNGVLLWCGPVAEILASDSNPQGILGRDVLALGKFEYDGLGQTWSFTF